MRHVEPHPKSGVFRVRLTAPPRLKPILGQITFTQSLETRDRREAERKAHGVIADFRRRIDAAEAVFEAERTGDAGGAAVVVLPHEAAAAIQRWSADARTRIAEAVWRDGPRASLRAVVPELGDHGPWGFVREHRQAVFERLTAPGCESLTTEYDDRLLALLRRLFGETGLALPPAERPVTQNALRLLDVAVHGLAAEQARWVHGEWTLPATERAGDPGHAAVAMRPDPAEGRGRLGAQLEPTTINSFLTDFLAEGRCGSASSEAELRLTVRRLLNFLDREDIYLHEISFPDAQEFRDALLHLPKHMTEADWQRGVRRLALDHKEGRDDRPRLLPATVGKGIRLLSSVMRLAVQRGRIERHVFEGLLMKGALKSKRPRKPFTASEIEAIFSAPLFTGCDSPERWWLPGTYALRDHRYWIPLIAQTMGLRLEEAGQLCVSDVPTLHGVACVAITEREDDEEGEDDEAEDTVARIKTESSKRFVPVHPILVQLGFLDMVAARRRSREKRLFPELTRTKAGKLTGAVSKWFCGRFLPKVGVVHAAKKFHSFRHTYCDNARNSPGIEPEVRKALMGHTSTAAHERYGDGHSMAVLRDAVDRLMLPGMPTAKLLAARAP